MDRAERKAALDSRIEALKNDPVAQELKSKAGIIPLAAMGTSLLAMYLGKRLISRPGVALKRPILFQVGKMRVYLIFV